MKTGIFRIITGGALVAALLASSTPMAPAEAQSFYKNRNVTVLIGSRPGGSYDGYARLLSRNLGRHIPGKPRLIPKNMPGAAGTRVANYLYKVAPKDGSVLAATLQSIAYSQAIGKRNVRYDARKFNWIGSPDTPNATVTTWHTTGVKTLEDARKKQVVMGVSTAGTTMEIFPTLTNNLLGTKFKMVTGYRGGKGVNLAMERGEVGGRGSNTWLSWKAFHSDWIRDKKINILVQVGMKKDPELQHVPLMIDLMKTKEAREMALVLSRSVNVGRPLMTAPGVPAARVALLRRAFDATMKDPSFVKDAKRVKLEVKPTKGEELQKTVEGIVNTPPAIIAALKATLKKRNATTCRKFTDVKYCKKKKKRKKKKKGS
jgi:tripartite-type tricarboxylate transporter receptor subunit TctC